MVRLISTMVARRWLDRTGISNARAKLAKKLEAAQKRVDKKAAEVKAQQDKVVESTSKGHGKRLAQRRVPWWR